MLKKEEHMAPLLVQVTDLKKHRLLGQQLIGALNAGERIQQNIMAA